MATEVIKIDPVNPQPEALGKAADYIRQGRLVAIPTETVYGIAADYANPEAVKRLYEVKNRPLDKPFSVAIANEWSLERLAADIPPLAYKLIERFWPGPLTLVLKAASGGTIGLRMPENRIALRIIEEAGLDVVLPSANLSGDKPAQEPSDILTALDGKIDLVVDAGRTGLGLESSVADVSAKGLRILREGAIKKEELERIAGLKRIIFVCTGNSCRSVMAQGLLQKAVKEKGRADIETFSCGISAFNGLPATDETLDLLSREGIDMSGHRSRRADRQFLRSADLILAMESYQEKRILELAPEAAVRLYLLKEFAGIKDSDLNISDPIGLSGDFYQRTFHTIQEAVKKVAEII